MTARTQRPVAVLLLLTTAVFAGCAGGSDAPALSTDEAAGRIEGRVLTDELAPVDGANVSVVGTDLFAATGDDGRFLLEDVPAGEHEISVARAGYETLVRPVVVARDETLTLDVRLEAIAGVTPFLEVLPIDGLIACGVSAPVVTATWGCGDANHKAYVAVNVTEGVRATVHETVWESTSLLTGQKLLTRMFIDGQMFDRLRGPSPIVRVVEGYKVDAPTEVGEQVYVDFATLEEPVILAYQQQFTTHFSLFFHQDPPQGYTALGG